MNQSTLNFLLICTLATGMLVNSIIAIVFAHLDAIGLWVMTATALGSGIVTVVSLAWINRCLRRPVV